MSNPINEGKPKSRGRHPNSLKNLEATKFKKGEVHNPIGARAHSPVKRAIKHFMNHDLQDIVHIACTGKLVDLKNIAEDENASSIERGVAACMYDAIVKKDWDKLRSIISEIVGKQPELINIKTASLSHIVVDYIDPEEK